MSLAEIAVVLARRARRPDAPTKLEREAEEGSLGVDLNPVGPPAPPVKGTVVPLSPAISRR
jgi:hypothetical protein